MLLDTEQIKEYLPHRYPFLFIDRVISCEPGKNLVAIKNVSIAEPVFQGHFPIKAVLPGVILVEAIAQASGIMNYISIGSKPKELGDLYYFAGIDKVRFKRPVVPGDQVTFEIEFIQQKNNYSIVKTKGVAKVDGELACTAEILIAKKASK